MARLKSRLNLEELTPDELRKMQAQIAAELSMRRTNKSQDRNALLEVWHRAQMEVWQARKGCKLPFPQWKQTHQRHVVPHLEAAEKLALCFFHEPPRAIQVHPARVFVARSIYMWLENVKMPLTYGTFAKALAHAGTALDDQFPNYRASGLLPAVLKAQGRNELCS